ncbi:DUF1768-domain-containing protein [Rhizophagus irregularis]|uniref:DUF1768-domain-containing protein n=3 Tax=Rhizophagus irregularis TaxID=588596 RepID=A0A2I1F3N1_9GLOM|nr:hypothetical protein GLOIN_2v1502381 [Rhizophagus irregularis DAOM 181602=DAOM 197198]EXX51293.1 hypothetical protein RirG_263130 [Rhizophagus irregularis DAOM 197198w]PKC02991.1 DUF1768-domain-containing protein [Rhizophagus irregularis]PKC64258.1 DUF1768-domain-containing protein [Rhizophagus irregularis]PKY28977.1 DUF1768-domain-containing protein [Rhizophagus irregularis]POG82054.1 hypothetical protein GLOIN_2v1502381 [Rhizophagus irregularis DAOM 181602=DAOM 197198]|eukprot:XP_025188920.1 hypothetical protein GLOIN_2v1502381 [Rhizophagus irregularis DAOM 181602=DAOM 197198]
MQNQHHNQQQKLQLQQGSQFSPTLPQPEINYGRNMKNSCDCSKMGKDERDPERCAFCKNDHYNISNELNSQGNQVMNEVRNDYDQIPINVQMYTNLTANQVNHHMMNQMNHQIQPPVREQPPPPNTIWFYNRNEPYYEFTNFKEGFPIKAAIREPFPGSPPDIKSWATSEHLFQAAKFKNTRPEIADKIRRCPTARDALNMARKYQQYVDPSWQSINVQVMEWVVKNKFEQHPILAKRLLGTGDQILVEHTELDRFWGDGGDGSGRNKLGEVLMNVRKHLRDTQLHLTNNNGEKSPLGGGTEANSIYSMSSPATSSTSSLPTSPMYAGNGNIHPVKKGQGSSQQSPIPPSPPPLPPRRSERRDLHKFQEEKEGQIQQQIHQQHQQQQQQQIVQQLQIQQQIQQMQQQQEVHLTHQYFQQMQPQQNVYIPTDNGPTYYASAPPPYSEHDNM